MDSILDSIKKLLGIMPEYTQFDADIIMHINSVFFTLYELGVGPAKGFRIEDNTTTWNSYISDNDALLDAAKIYTYQKVRLSFDPPTNSALLEALKASTQELEWRMNVMVDPSDTFFSLET